MKPFNQAESLKELSPVQRTRYDNGIPMSAHVALFIKAATFSCAEKAKP